MPITLYTPTQFSRILKHETDCCKMCTASGKWRPETKQALRVKSLQYQNKAQELSKILLLQNMKIQLNCWRLEYSAQIHTGSQVAQKSFAKREFYRCFQERQKRLFQCKNSEVYYFQEVNTKLYLLHMYNTWDLIHYTLCKRCIKEVILCQNFRNMVYKLPPGLYVYH